MALGFVDSQALSKRGLLHLKIKVKHRDASSNVNVKIQHHHFMHRKVYIRRCKSMSWLGGFGNSALLVNYRQPSSGLVSPNMYVLHPDGAGNVKNV